jgi:hypothetical protein
MITRNGVTAMGLMKAFILAVSVATVARAGMSYLPLTGPKSLRVLAAKPPKGLETTIVAAKLLPLPAADNCTNSFPQATTETDANNSRYPLPPISLGAGNPLDATAGGSIFVLGTPDFLSLTPEMLAAYFTPVAGSTNAVVIPAPFHVGFVPPLLQIQKSSSAEYIIK